jgi:predicted RNase H-like HicB family nuclease
MRVFTAVIEKRPDTNLYVGFVPGFPGAHSQGATLDELNANLKEVIEMLLEHVLLRQIAKDIGLTIDEFLRHR